MVLLAINTYTSYTWYTIQKTTMKVLLLAITVALIAAAGSFFFYLRRLASYSVHLNVNINYHK